MSEALFALPGGYSQTELGAFGQLAGKVGKGAAVDAVAFGHNGVQEILVWFFGQGLAEVGFASYDGGQGFPGVGGGIARFKTDSKVAVAAFVQPVKVGAGVFDHAGFEVGAVDLVAHEEGFLEDDAGAAERVEYGGIGSGRGEVDDDLGKFGWQHADFGVTLGAVLVAATVGFDVLFGDGLADKCLAAISVGYDFESQSVGQLVVEDLGAVERGGLVGNDTDAAASVFDEPLKAKAAGVEFGGTGAQAVGAEAQLKFTLRQAFEDVGQGCGQVGFDAFPFGGGEFGLDLCQLYCAAKTVEVDVLRFDVEYGGFGANGLNVIGTVECL